MEGEHPAPRRERSDRPRARCRASRFRRGRKEARELRVTFRKARPARHRGLPTPPALWLVRPPRPSRRHIRCDRPRARPRMQASWPAPGLPRRSRTIAAGSGANSRCDAADRRSDRRPRPVIRRHRHECRASRMLHGGEEGLRNGRRGRLQRAQVPNSTSHRALETVRRPRRRDKVASQQAARLLAGCDDHRGLVAERGEESCRAHGRALPPSAD